MSKFLHVYQSTIPYVKMIRTDGKELAFREGKYHTDDKGDIEFLEKEIAIGHPHISKPQNESEQVIESSMLDPMTALYSRIEQEVRAKIAAEAASGDLNKDMGKTEQEPLKPASSVDVAQAMLGGSGQSMAERLALMKQAGKSSGSADESNGAKLVNLPTAQ